MKKAKAKVVAPSIPEIYRDVTKDVSLQHWCLVEDVHGQFFRYPTAAENNIVKQAIQRIWKNFNEFSDMPKQDLLTYHANIFKAEPPKDQDLVTTAVMCWFWLMAHVTNIAAVQKTPTTDSGRKSSISNSKYSLGTVVLKRGEEAGIIKTPQAIACYRIFCDAIEEQRLKDIAGMPEELAKTHVASITEEALKSLVIARAGELKTRQDPWRIFQYYRPTLIASNLLRRN